MSRNTSIISFGTLLLASVIAGTCLGQSPDAGIASPPSLAELALQTPAAPLGENDSILDASGAASSRLFQEFKSDLTYLPGGGSGGFGIQDLEVSLRLALPLGERLPPLQVTPGGAIHLWQGPGSSAAPFRTDLPPRLYDLYTDFGWRPQLARWLFADVGITPGLYTDFETVNSSSFRMRGRGLGIVAFSEKFQFVAGALYVNRNNVKVLPAGGILWKPSEDTNLELVFPQPKISQRLGHVGPVKLTAYLAGEYGGGAWSVEHADGTPDSVDYTDIRLIGGLEWDTAMKVRGHLEVGYAFSRTIDYTSPAPNIDPANCVMLRVGLRY